MFNIKNAYKKYRALRDERHDVHHTWIKRLFPGPEVQVIERDRLYIHAPGNGYIDLEDAIRWTICNRPNIIKQLKEDVEKGRKVDFVIMLGHQDGVSYSFLIDHAGYSDDLTMTLPL